MCTGNDCIDWNERVLKSFDLNVNPCDNFYKFVCGKMRKRYAESIVEYNFMEFATAVMREWIRMLENDNELCY